jgi:hypothetical protein
MQPGGRVSPPQPQRCPDASPSWRGVLSRSAGLRPGVSNSLEPRRVGDRHSGSITMKACLPLRGIVTVLNTPFTAANELDVAALRRHVRKALAAGVAGFLVPAMASEVDKLTPAERELFVGAVLEEVNGRAVVIGGASAPSGAERVRLARELVAAGCNGLLVSIPYQDDKQYASVVREVADMAPPFLMLQDWDPTGYGVPVATLARLFETVESVRAVKRRVRARGTIPGSRFSGVVSGGHAPTGRRRGAVASRCACRRSETSGRWPGRTLQAARDCGCQRPPRPDNPS